MEKQISGKVCFLGNVGVGKTSVVRRLCSQLFYEYESSTIGAAFNSIKQKRTDDTGAETTVSAEIWDTAGQETYHALGKMYYRNSNVVVFVVSVAKKEYKESLSRVIQYLHEIPINCEEPPMYFVVLNKVDLVDDPADTLKDVKDAIDSNGRRKTKEYDNYMKFFTTSALEDVGITDLRLAVFDEINRTGKVMSEEDEITFPIPGRGRRNRCC